MKKLFTKLVLFTLISLILSTAAPYVHAESFFIDNYENALEAAEAEKAAQEADRAAHRAKAEENLKNIDTLNKALSDIQKPEKQCVLTGEGEPDFGYLITTVEEPLPLSEVITEGEERKNFETRICYRNTFSATYSIEDSQGNIIESKTQTVPELANECSANAIALANTPEMVEEYQITFSCEEVQVLLSKGGTTLLMGYISMLYKWGASVAGIIAILVIVLNGIRISASAGDTQAIDSAKSAIIQSIAGIAILLLSALILYTINPNFYV